MQGTKYHPLLTEVLNFISNNLGKTFHSPRKDVFKSLKEPMSFSIIEISDKNSRIIMEFESATKLPLEFWRFSFALTFLEQFESFVPIGARISENYPSGSLEHVLKEEEKKRYNRLTGTKTAPHIADLLVLANLAEYSFIKSSSGRKVQGVRLISSDIGKKSSKKLIIVPCANKKIWDDPKLDSISPLIPARRAYIGIYSRACINYAEAQERNGNTFLILSTKYGFLTPDELIDNYSSPKFIMSKVELRYQSEKLDLKNIFEIEVVASRKYYKMVKFAFKETKIPVKHLLANLRIGESIQKLNTLVEKLESKTQSHYVEYSPSIALDRESVSLTAKREDRISINEPFYCLLCEKTHPRTMNRVKCPNCARIFCVESIQASIESGLTQCPYCPKPLDSFKQF